MQAKVGKYATVHWSCLHCERGFRMCGLNRPKWVASASSSSRTVLQSWGRTEM